MTTIAYKAGELVADSQCSSGGVVMGSVVKIARRDDGTLTGGCGDTGWCYRFVQWVLAGEEGDFPSIPTDNDGPVASGFVIRPDGTVWVYESNGPFLIEGPYHAWGPGREFALGAMFLGATAIGAVSAAIHHSAGSGGKMTVLRHEG